MDNINIIVRAILDQAKLSSDIDKQIKQIGAKTKPLIMGVKLDETSVSKSIKILEDGSTQLTRSVKTTNNAYGEQIKIVDALDKKLDKLVRTTTTTKSNKGEIAYWKDVDKITTDYYKKVELANKNIKTPTQLKIEDTTGITASNQRNIQSAKAYQNVWNNIGQEIKRATLEQQKLEESTKRLNYQAQSKLAQSKYNSTNKSFFSNGTFDTSRFDKSLGIGNTTGINAQNSALAELFDKSDKGYKGFSKLEQQVVKTNKVIKDSSSAAQKASKSMQELGKSSEKSAQSMSSVASKILTWTLLTSAVFLPIHIIQDGIKTIYELDSAITDLKKVSDELGQSIGIKEFTLQVNQMAIDVGHSTKDAIDAIAEFKRTGFSLNDSETLAKQAMIYSNIGDVDIAESTKSIISTLKGFNLTAQDTIHIMDTYNEVGNNFSISSEGIGSALQRSSSALYEANNSLEESIGLIVAGNASIQNPEKVGNGLKTVSMRLRGISDEAGIAVPELDKLISSLTGVDIMANDTTFKSTYEILLEISKVWKDIDDIDQATLLEKMFGKQQGATGASILNNMTEGANAMATAIDSFGSSTKEQEAYMTSLEAKVNNFKETVSKQWIDAINTDSVKSLVDGATELVDIYFNMNAIIIQIVTGLILWKGAAITSALSTKKLSMSMKLVNAESRLFNTIGKAMQLQEMGLLTTTQALGFSFKALGVSIKTAFLSNPLGWVMLGVSFIVPLFQHLSNSTDEQIKKAEELTTAYNDMKASTTSNISTLESLESEFATLSKGVNENGENVGLSADQYSRYKEIVDQIVGISPELIKGYNAEGDVLVNNNGLIQKAIDLQEQYNKAKTAEYLTKGDDVFKSKLDQNIQQSGKGSYKATQDFKKVLDGVNLKPVGIDVNFTTQGILTKEQMQQIVDKKEEIINLATKELGLDETKKQNLKDTIASLESQLTKMNSINQEATSFMSLYASVNGITDGINTDFLDEFNIKIADIVANSSSFEEAQNGVNQLANDFKDLQDKLPTESIEELQTQLSDGEISTEEYNKKIKNSVKTVEDLAKSYIKTNPILSAFLTLIAQGFKDFATNTPEISNYESAVKEMDTVVSDYAGKLKYLQQIEEKVRDEQSLSYDEKEELIAQYPELEDNIYKTADGYSVEISALELVGKTAKATALETARASKDRLQTALNTALEEIKINGSLITSYEALWTAMGEKKVQGMFKKDGQWQVGRDPNSKASKWNDEYNQIQKAKELLDDAEKEINSMSSGSILGGDKTKDKKEATIGLVDATQSLVDTLEKQVKLDEILNGNLEKQIKKAEYAGDYNKQLELQNQLLQNQKKTLADLLTANQNISKEADKVRATNGHNTESWFNPDGSDSTAYTSLLNSFAGLTSGTSDGGTSLSGNAGTISNFLSEKGFSNAGIAGVLGNLQSESSFNPKSVQANGNGRGLVQWDKNNRYKTMVAFAKSNGLDPDSLNAQLQFMYKEMGDYGVLDSVKNATSAQTAAKIFGKKYEKYGTAGGRYNYTDEWYNQLTRGGKSSTSKKSTTQSAYDNIKNSHDQIQTLKSSWWENKDAIDAMNESIIATGEALYNTYDNNSKNWIEEQNFYDTWKEIGDSESQALNRRRDRLEQFYADGIVSAKFYAENIKDIEHDLHTAIQEQIKKTFELEEKTERLQAEKDVYGKKTQEEYEKYHNNIIKGYEEDIDKLQEKADVEDEITERKKRQLELQELQLKLTNTLNNKNTQILKQNADGQWDYAYVADPDAVDSINKEIQDKETDNNEWELDNERKHNIAKIQEDIDYEEELIRNKKEAYDEQIEIVDEAYKDIEDKTSNFYKDLVKRCKEGNLDLVTELKKWADEMGVAYAEITGEPYIPLSQLPQDGKPVNNDNETAYLNNLIKNGTSGQKIWAENELKKYTSDSGGNNKTTTTTTPTAPKDPDNQKNYLKNLSKNGSEGQKKWANDQLKKKLYDTGGLFPTDMLAENKSGSPERILSPEQTKAFDIWMTKIPDLVKLINLPTLNVPNFNNMDGNKTSVEQNITIQATFPNITDSSSIDNIKSAILSLPTKSLQFIK